MSAQGAEGEGHRARGEASRSARAQLPARRARAPRALPAQPCVLPAAGPAEPAHQAPAARQTVQRARLRGGAEEAGGGEGYERSEEGSSHRSCRPEAAADPTLNEAFKPSLHLVQQERNDLGHCSLAPNSRIFEAPLTTSMYFKNPLAVKIIVTIKWMGLYWHLGRHGREGWN